MTRKPRRPVMTEDVTAGDESPDDDPVDVLAAGDFLPDVFVEGDCAEGDFVEDDFEEGDFPVGVFPAGNAPCLVLVSGLGRAPREVPRLLMTVHL